MGIFFYSFEIGRRRFFIIIIRRRETSALRACFSCNLYDEIWEKPQNYFKKSKQKMLPPRWSQKFLGQNNIKNEFSTIKLLECKFSAKSDDF